MFVPSHMIVHIDGTNNRLSLINFLKLKKNHNCVKTFLYTSYRCARRDPNLLLVTEQTLLSEFKVQNANGPFKTNQVGFESRKGSRGVSSLRIF